ncbi:hypothetical protein HK405_001260 [Cladochytrium tenue]|nr:hypothetical protein HK405_001260 [Cladochytrium tenue]
MFAGGIVGEYAGRRVGQARARLVLAERLPADSKLRELLANKLPGFNGTGQMTVPAESQAHDYSLEGSVPPGMAPTGGSGGGSGGRWQPVTPQRLPFPTPPPPLPPGETQQRGAGTDGSPSGSSWDRIRGASQGQHDGSAWGRVRAGAASRSNGGGSGGGDGFVEAWADDDELVESRTSPSATLSGRTAMGLGEAGRGAPPLLPRDEAARRNRFGDPME